MEESYGDDLAYGRVRVHPPSVDFVDVEVGIKYVIKVAVKNVSSRQERVRFIAPPRGSGFAVRNVSTSSVAPGMEVCVEVEYVLASTEDSHAALKVDVSGKVLEIPCHAYRPRGELALETLLNFGPVVHEKGAWRTLQLVNKGKAACGFAFDISAVDAAGDDPARRGRSSFTIAPAKGEIGAGETVELRVEIDGRALGPARALARLAVRGGMGPSLVDLAANVLMQRVELLDARGVLAPERISFGNVYAGLGKTRACTVVNNGPKPISFVFATLGEDEQPQELAEDEELDRDASDAAFVIEPADGLLEPFASVVVAIRFKPPPKPPSKAGFRATRAELDQPPRFAVGKRLTVLETDQKINLILEGTAVTAAVSLSRASVQFAQPCRLYDHQDTTVTITNNNLEMAVDFSADRVPNFAIAPAAGRLAPGASRELLVTFAPKQQGALAKTLALQLFKGAVLALPLHVSGVCQGTNGRRKLVGGPLALPEHFAHALELAPTTVRPVGGGIAKLALTQPVGELARTTGRPSTWERDEQLDASLAALGSLTKRRTFAAQQEPALQAALDRKMKRETGFELSARELAALASHKERYVGYLRQSHADRSAREQARFVRPAVADLAEFELGVEMGMASLSARGAHPLEGGWSPFEPRLALPKAREPLWLEHAYDLEGHLVTAGKGGGARVLLFDDRKLIRRKHKPTPTTQEELAQCGMSLQPKELLQVAGGPKLVNFGTVSVMTVVHRSFNVANDLLTHVLVAVDAADEPELARSTPATQVVPPTGVAGFDLLFSSAEVGPFRKTISYSINDRYSYKFTAVAEVVPIDVELSTDELKFQFDGGDLGPNLALPVTLYNRGTYKADFEVRGPSHAVKRPAAFAVSHERGSVEPGKSLVVVVTYTPSPGAANEHMLTFVVEGGPSRALLCRAEHDEPKCAAEPRKLEFGLCAVGVPKDLALTIQNAGAEPAVLYWDAPPAGLEVIPMMAQVPAGGSVDVLFILSPAAPLKLDATFSATVRGGKPVKVALTADVQLPQLAIAEDELAFGTVTVGATALRALTLVNSGPLAAALDLRLGAHASFELVYVPPPRDDDDAAAPVADDDAEPPVQPLSTAEDARAEIERKRRRSALPRPDTAALDDDAPNPADERDYRINVPAHGTLALQLRFAPRAEGAFEFELPMSHVGLAVSPALRRAVSAAAAAARVAVAPRRLDLGNCVCRAAEFPYTAELTLDNIDPARQLLAWELDVSALRARGLVALAPTSGHLGPAESVRIRVRFACATPCELRAVQLPLYLDGERAAPYLTVELSARGVRPRLTFDRAELVLPPVPLGVTSRASFLVVNDGYDNLEVAHKLPADSAKVPLALAFPAGNMLGLGRQTLPCTLSFASSKPMSFTAKVLMLDADGRRFALAVSGSTDNSVLTMQSWLREHAGTYEWVVAPGQPLSLAPLSEAALQQRAATTAARRAPSSRAGVASATGGARPGGGGGGAGASVVEPPIRPEWPSGAALARAIQLAEREAAVLDPWVRAFLLDLPSQKPFPAALIAARGKPLVEVLEAVSGKSVASLVPREAAVLIARPPRSKVALARALVAQYDALLTFLKQHGALLSAVRPEELLGREDYVRFHDAARRDASEAAEAAMRRAANASRAAAGGASARGAAGAPPAAADGGGGGGGASAHDGRYIEPTLSDVERRELLARHRLASLGAWSSLFYQAIRVFVLVRVTPRSLRTTPGAAELIGKHDDFEAALGGSNALTANDAVLLHWLTLHWRKVRPEAAVGELERVSSFEQLRDGHVLAALLLSHAPFLAPAEGGAAEEAEELDADAAAAAKERARPGSSLARLHPAPCDDDARLRNLELCVGAMTVGLAMERAPAADVFAHGSERDLTLVVLGLYQTLPHYVPKTTVEFAGALHEEVTKTIELTNPARKPIQYLVRVEGASVFELPLGKVVRIEPRQALAFPVTFASKFAADASARLLFLSRGDGVSTAHATSLSFILSARITSKRPHATLTVESPLYVATERDVVVTNPFADTCTFAIALSERRPPLDIDPASVGGVSLGATGGRGDAPGKPSQRAAETAASSIAGYGMSTDRAAELERALSKLPASFHVVSSDPRKPETTLAMQPGAKATIRMQFLPFMLGEHACEISFVDAKRGEFVYLLNGTGSLPLPTETISFRADAGTQQTLHAALPFRNEPLERARADALRRLAKVRDKDLERSRDALRKSPLYFKLEFSGTFFGGPQSIELAGVDGGAKKKRAGGGGGTASGTTTPARRAGALSGTATPREPGESSRGLSSAGGGGGDNTVALLFAPKLAGAYSSKLVLYSPLDVRVFHLQGSAPAPGTRATLEFAAPARRSIKQEIPIVNNSAVAWELSAALSGQYFKGPNSLRVAAGQTELYPLEFNPEWVCDAHGALTLTNVATADTFAYALHGTGEEPLSEGSVLIDVVARQRATHEFAVFNVSADGKECACEVESDLMHVAGEPTVVVPARTGGVPFGKQQFVMAPAGRGVLSPSAQRQPAPPAPPPAAAAATATASAASFKKAAPPKPPPARYTLAITPQLGGSVHGSITIRAPDGRYLWYTVEIRAAPPPAERTIEVSADVRTAAVIEVEVANPSREAVEFAIALEGEGLLGATNLSIGPGPDSVAKYELIYSPLAPGLSSGAISFVNASVGEFWYKLLLTATQPAPAELTLQQVELGKTGTELVRVDNPLGERLELRAHSSNARNWTVGTRGGAPIVLPPFGSAEVVVQYSPSALGVEQGALLTLSHPALAPWEFAARGLGLPPTTMASLEVSAELGGLTSGTAQFVNPFDQPLAVQIGLEAPPERPDAFALLLRKTGLVVAAGARVQIPFTFAAADMSELAARIVVAAEGAQRLRWVYPLVGYAQSRPMKKPLQLAVRARAQLQTMLELPLVGFDAERAAHGGGGVSFTVELDDVPEELAHNVGSSMRIKVAGRPSDELMLPIAVQWTPLKPLKAAVSLLVRQVGGGRWKYNVLLNASQPEPDDVIEIEAALNRSTSVAFSLANAFNVDAEYEASFTTDSNTVFAVRPAHGVLPRAGSAGQQLIVTFSPVEYGKTAVGTLLITTAEMQWAYEVHGKPPVFVVPEAKKRIDDRMHPELERRMLATKLAGQTTNYVRKNMNQASKF